MTIHTIKAGLIFAGDELPVTGTLTEDRSGYIPTWQGVLVGADLLAAVGTVVTMRTSDGRECRILIESVGDNSADVTGNGPPPWTW